MSSDWKDAWTPVLAWIGKDFSSGEARFGADRIEAGAVRKYLEPLEFDCALHYDDAIARAHGHPGIIVPYTSISSFAMQGFWAPGKKISRTPSATRSPKKPRSNPCSRQARRQSAAISQPIWKWNICARPMSAKS